MYSPGGIPDSQDEMGSQGKMDPQDKMVFQGEIDYRGIKSNYAVGKYNGEYKGWHRMTINEVNKNNNKYELINAHGEKGWPILEEILICNDVLSVEDGFVIIGDKYVTNVEFNSKPMSLRGVYHAKMWFAEYEKKGISWVIQRPDANVEWYAEMPNTNITEINPPCLFVRDLPESGGKKTRRRKHSRKQRRTRKQ